MLQQVKPEQASGSAPIPTRVYAISRESVAAQTLKPMKIVF
jgi:hypothetical protein